MGLTVKSVVLCVAALFALAVAAVPASARKLPRHRHLARHAVDPASFVATYEPSVSAPAPKLMIMIGIGY